ncbi:MAG: hypothetical protein IJ565_02035 [Bacilli bacterium]|nr:hypothetical protein [Bacilli bacterium]
MDKYDELKMLYGAYYGVMDMDSYKTKEFVLKDIKELINYFIEENNIIDTKETEMLAKEQPLITRLHDSLIVLKRLDASLELTLLIKEKINELKHAK